jgi:alpha-tubulin suppressor-like RCC1 family protein
VPTKITHDTHWQKISSGAQHTCAIASDQTLWCWGNNSKGQLGLPTSSLIQSATPRQVIADNVTAFTHLAVGDQHTCALDEEQSLWCWGVNDKGQCGNSSSENGMLTPMRVGNNTTWTELAAGADITCAIRQSGSLFCWGAIIFNEALPDSVLHVETPTLMDNNHHYVHVEAGDGFIIALDQEGYRYGRGKNNYGQLGNNSAWRLQPTLLSIPNTSP